jgi:hypothetical protein
MSTYNLEISVEMSALSLDKRLRLSFSLPRGEPNHRKMLYKIGFQVLACTLGARLNRHSSRTTLFLFTFLMVPAEKEYDLGFSDNSDVVRVSTGSR